MPRICYTPREFKPASLAVIDQANRIIKEYAGQGFSLTLRQLYYQFVARDLIPNTQRDYKRLGSIVNDGRLAGLIDWEAITDRTRFVRRRSHWDGPADVIDSAAASYGIDLWEGQPHRLEVWIEKDALVGVIEEVCTDWDVPFLSCRGYVSQSETWQAAMRMRAFAKAGQKPVILHLGDHDPSGIDMTRDNGDRANLLSGVDVQVKRLALNMDQVEQYEPPPNPTKLTDSRAGGYLADYGRESWELDALEPRVLVSLIESAIRELVDLDLWEERHEQQERERAEVHELAQRYAEVRGFLDEEAGG